MIDASAGLRTASCPQCDLLFSVESPPTLTAEEREAVEWAIYEEPLRSQAEGAEERAATLRKLLERLA